MGSIEKVLKKIWKIIVFIPMLWYKYVKYKICNGALQISKRRNLMKDLINTINDDEYFKFLKLKEKIII